MHVDVRRAQIPELAGALEQVAREVEAQLGDLSVSPSRRPSPRGGRAS